MKLALRTAISRSVAERQNYAMPLACWLAVKAHDPVL